MDENTNNDFSTVAKILAIDYEKIKSIQVSSNEQSFQESYKRLKLHNLVEFESSSDDVIHCDKLLNTIVDCYSEDKSLKVSLLVEIITIRKYLIDLQNIGKTKFPSIESFVTDIETDNRKGINSGSLSNALVDARELIAKIKLNKIRASQIVGNAGNREIAVKWIESKLIELETPLKFSLLLVLENAKLYNNTLRTIIESGIDNTYISDEKLRIEFHKNELNKRIEHDVQEKLYKESLEKRNFALGNEIKGKRKFTRTFVIQNTSWQRINELAEFNDVESSYEYLLKICHLDTGVKANNILLRDQTEVRKSISNGGQWSYLKLIPKKEYTQVEVSIDLDGSHSAMKTESNVVDINSAKQKTDSELVSDQYKSYEEYIIQNFGQLPKGVIEQIEMDERLNDGEDDLLLELANRLKEEKVKSSATASDQSLRTQNLDLFSGVSTTDNGISIPENNYQEITPAFYQEILESEKLTLKYQDALDSIFTTRLVEIRNEMAMRGWRPNDVGPGMNKDISTSTSQATYTMTFSFEKKGAGGNVVKMSAMLGGSKIINDDLKKTPYELAFDITSSITNVMVNGNMTLTYDSSYLGVFTGRVDLSGTTAMHEVLMLEGHEANQKKLVYSSPNENLLVIEQDYDRARELIKNHPELSRNLSIAAANALQNAYGDKGLPKGYISRNTLSGIEGNFIDAEWFIEKLTDLTESVEASDKIKEKASILLSMLNESHGAPHIYSYKIVPEDNGFRLHSLHRNLDQLGLWSFSEDDLKEKLKSAISIFDTSDFFEKRWTSVRGTVTDVRQHSLAPNGVGSELPQRAGYFPNRYFSFTPSGYTEINELGDISGLKKEAINTIMGGRQAIVTSWSDDNGNGFEVREFQLKEGEELPDTNEKINEAEEHLSTYRILDEKHGKLEIIKVGELDFENVYDATKTLTKLQLNKRGYLEDIYNWLGGSMFPGSAIKGEIVPVDKIRKKLTWVSGADVLKVKRLESANEMSLREPLIIEALIASGKLEKLLSFAGKKSYDTFSDLPNSEKIEAYFKFIDSGEQPIEFSETYNEYAERLEKEALHRRLSSTNQIVQTNGKPFKTEKSADTFLTEQSLAASHRVEPVDGGFALLLMPLAHHAETKHIAEGRESYIDAQESVLRLLGYETNDQGEYEIADREWEQVDRLTESRLNRNAPENTVEKLLSEFNDVGFGMTLRIVDKGLWFVIAKEPYEQGKYRWQSFDETGFIIHKTFDSPEQAIEHAYALGASVIAPFETLDGLAASEEWANSLVSPRQESNFAVDKKLSNGAEDYVGQLKISDTNQERVQSQIAQTHLDLVLERAAIGRLVNREKGIVTFIDPDNGIETVDLRQYRQNVFSYEEKIGIQAWVDFSTKKELLAAYEQLVERRKKTHLESEKNEMLELSNEDKELRTVEIRKVLLPYMTAAGFYSSLSGTNLASVRAQALGVLHNEPKYPLSKSGINALIDDLAIFAGIDLDNTAAGKDSDLSDWIKGAHKTVEEKSSNEIQAEVSILGEHDTEREKLAHRYMEIMKNYYTGHSKINDMHYKVADGILNKDAYAIEHIANGMNKALVSFFQEVTGIKLPKTQGGIWDEVLKWAGISKEFDTLRTAKRNYNREKEVLLKKFNNGNEVVQMFENHIENGFVELKKIARQMHLYNPKTNQGYNLSSKGTNLAKTQDYVAARLEVYKAELNISLSSKSEANISLIDNELTYKKVGDSWMPDFSQLSSLEGDDLLPHINKLTEGNLHAEAAMLRAMRLKDTSLFERALAYQQHTYKNKCILPEYSTEVSKLHELLSTAEHNLENKINACEKSAHIESIPTKEEIPYMHSMEDGKNIKVYSYTTGVQLKNSDEFVGICTGIDTNSFWYIGREFGERTYNRLNAVSITDAYAEAKLKKLSPEYSLESEALQDQITNADYQRLDDRHLNNDESPSTASEYLGFTCYHELADDEWLPHEFCDYKNLLAGYDCLRKFGTPASGFQIVIGRENSDVKSAHSLGECLIVTIEGEFVKSFGGNHQNANETIFELLESDLWASHISKVNLNSAQSKVVLDLITEGKTFKFTKNSQFFKDVAILNYEENEFKLLDGNGVTHNIEGGNVYKVKELLDSLDSKKEIHWAEASSSSDIALYSLLEKQNHQEFAMN